MPQTVLIVEDEKDIRETIAEILVAEGYQVVTVENGQEALNALQKIESPCLVLLDLMMPVLSGEEFLQIVSKDISLAAIPIVALSALTDKSKASLARGFLKKPVDLDLLLRTVKSHCGNT